MRWNEIINESTLTELFGPNPKAKFAKAVQAMAQGSRLKPEMHKGGEIAYFRRPITHPNNSNVQLGSIIVTVRMDPKGEINQTVVAAFDRSENELSDTKASYTGAPKGNLDDIVDAMVMRFMKRPRG